MAIRLTGTSSSDYKTLFPPINLGEKSGYNEAGLRRIEFTYVNRTISNVFRGVNYRLWFKFSLGDVDNPQYIEIDFGKEANGTPKNSGTYDTNKIVLALNTALALKKKLPTPNPDGSPGAGAPTPALYNGRAGSGIQFSVDTNDKIVMQVAGDSVVFLGVNSFIEKNPLALENDMLWFKNNHSSANNYSISFPPGYYNSIRLVEALNRGLDSALSLYNPSRRGSSGIIFSVSEGDKIVMKVVGEYVVLLASDISGVINNIGDTLEFNTKEQGTYAPDYDYVDGREEDKKD